MAASDNGPIDTHRIEAAVSEILAAIGENPDRPGLASTPHLVAQAYAEFFSGVGVDPKVHLSEAVETTAGSLSEAVLVRNIDFRSICEHHLLPFVGVAHLAYLPGRRIVGLGKLPKVVDTLASRPQLQERLTEQIADALQEALEPRGVLVVLDARHGCVTLRGAKQPNSSTVTVATRGALSAAAARAELMAMIGSAASAASIPDATADPDPDHDQGRAGRGDAGGVDDG
ncbi:MAG: GTP cyclohydrolase I FolE [Microbacteriaceae bacterium]